MNPADILLVLLLALIIYLAVRKILRNRKCGCGCGCGSPECRGCAGRKRETESNPDISEKKS